MSEFSHLKDKLLVEQVEDQLYHYILDTPLEPGSKLPNEFKLGERFGVGRSTIREAVKLLVSKGILEVRRGSGTYVVTMTKGLSDPLGLRAVKDKTRLAFDLVNVRLMLEPGIAEMAAQNATKEDIERMRRLCERVEEKIQDVMVELILYLLYQQLILQVGKFTHIESPFLWRRRWRHHVTALALHLSISNLLHQCIRRFGSVIAKAGT